MTKPHKLFSCPSDVGFKFKASSSSLKLEFEIQMDHFWKGDFEYSFNEMLNALERDADFCDAWWNGHQGDHFWSIASVLISLFLIFSVNYHLYYWKLKCELKRITDIITVSLMVWMEHMSLYSIFAVWASVSETLLHFVIYLISFSSNRHTPTLKKTIIEHFSYSPLRP